MQRYIHTAAELKGELLQGPQDKGHCFEILHIVRRSCPSISLVKQSNQFRFSHLPLSAQTAILAITDPDSWGSLDGKLLTH